MLSLFVMRCALFPYISDLKIIVHTTSLLSQWRAQLADYLSVEINDSGTLGGERKKQIAGVLNRFSN